jgi:hypothetical protein
VYDNMVAKKKPVKAKPKAKKAASKGKKKK